MVKKTKKAKTDSRKTPSQTIERRRPYQKSCGSKSRLRQSHPECGIVFARSDFFTRAFRGSGPKSGGDPEGAVQRFLALFAGHAAIDPCLFPWGIPQCLARRARLHHRRGQLLGRPFRPHPRRSAIPRLPRRRNCCFFRSRAHPSGAG